MEVMLLNQVRFARRTASPNAETLTFAARGVRKAASPGDRDGGLVPDSPP